MTNFDYINCLKTETTRLKKVINSYEPILLNKVINDYFTLVENATKCYEGKIIKTSYENKTRFYLILFALGSLFIY